VREMIVLIHPGTLMGLTPADDFTRGTRQWR